MPNIFGVDVKTLVTNALKGNLLTIYLIKPDDSRYPFDGIIEWKSEFITGSLEIRPFGSVTIIRGSLPDLIVPEEEDIIEYEGQTWRLLELRQRDTLEAADEWTIGK